MKRNFTLAILALIVGACSSDSDEKSNSDPKMNLVAKWNLQRITYNQGEFDELSDCEKKSNWTFSQDYKLYIREFSQKEDTGCTDLNPENYSIDYSLSANTVSYTVPDGGINGGPYTVNYKVSQLSPSTLQLTAVYEVDGITPEHPKYAEAPFEGEIPFEYQWTYIFSK